MKPKVAKAILLFTVLGVTPVFSQSGSAKTQPSDVQENQQPTDAQLAKLFDVMRVKQQLTATTKMLPQVMQEEVRQQFMELEKDHPEMRPSNEQQQEALAAVMSKYMGKAVNLYSADEMLADMSAIYKRHLTGTDVNAVTAFYSSPAGQHMLDMNAAVMTEFMPAVMHKMQSRMRPLVLEMTQEISNAVKAPAAKTPETGAKPEQK